MVTRNLTPEDLIDRAEIHDALMNYATGIDSRDWGLYRSLFTDDVEIDFSSWSGEPGGMMKADDWVAGVKTVLTGFDGTQHLLANEVITLKGDEAEVVPYMQAHHYLKIDGEHHLQSIGGYYRHHMIRTEDGWKSRSCKLTVTWEKGDRGLFEIATKRAADILV
ncbi:MAG: nuclear transport factor 2 family protein [Parasphingorhabdus sp.]